MSLWTLGVFASLYAGYLKPELRVTCSNLSSVINGLATIMMFVFIDPQVSLMTDDVVEGRGCQTAGSAGRSPLLLERVSLVLFSPSFF